MGAENDKQSDLGNGQFMFFEKFLEKNWKKKSKKKVSF